MYPLPEAIVRTVAYVDIFDFPLTAAEIHRYLKGVRATPAAVRQALQGEEFLTKRLSRVDGLYALPGREEIVATRKARREIAARLWPQAVRYGRQIGALPFVRMTAVTGSLAVDNAASDADIDFFIVSAAGRVWLSRAFVVLVVRLAARRGIHLCPNYFLSDQMLSFTERDLYAAHELAQMVLIAGHEVYGQLWADNSWMENFLPNAAGPPRELALAEPSKRARPWSSGAEFLLSSRLGSRLEKWEMERKVAKFARLNGSLAATEAAFSAHWCKGHFDNHGQKTIDAYVERVSSLNRS